jgi:hypothetical protein
VRGRSTSLVAGAARHHEPGYRDPLVGTMKQHYLPRFYLQAFCDPGSEKAREPYAWVYYRGERKWKKRAPKNIAAKPNLYSVTDRAGVRNDEFENLLCFVEAAAAKVIGTKVVKRRPLDPDDRVAMAYFVALIVNRLPAFLDQWSRFIVGIQRDKMRFLAQNPEAFNALRRDYEKKTGDKFPDWFGPQHMDPDRYKIVPSKQSVLGVALRPINAMADVLGRMNWTLLTTTLDAPFITSDCPFCPLGPGPDGRPIGLGLLHKKVQISMPLRADVALLATWVRHATGYMKAQGPQVRNANLRTIAGAREFVVSPKPDFIGSEVLARWSKNEESNSRRRPA